MTTGFIILRHVNSSLTDQYWKHSYDCVREYYPNAPIVILEDNSNLDLITPYQLDKNTTVVETSGIYRGSAELAPYIYYHKHKWFDKAIIIHDSIFINSFQNFSNIENYQFLWHFNSRTSEKIPDQVEKLSIYNDIPLLEHHVNQVEDWNGCFGVMSVITYKFLNKVCYIYDLDKLVPFINSRMDRMDLERIIASMFQYISNTKNHVGRFGDIHKYCKWGITFSQKERVQYLPVIKVWTGR